MVLFKDSVISTQRENEFRNISVARVVRLRKYHAFEYAYKVHWYRCNRERRVYHRNKIDKSSQINFKGSRIA
jgi:hypothetical protein